ncbi:hypothetical protein [Hyphomonas sp.]|uniref:hypothetical protein n=1 Tax=Hyphomonas sp. TaxID=87 RepID=UPI0025B99793|nr:hypothetical protein [Hyphomonas sp.]MBI1399419.1 hypothetical protein [Hyphomonas sp.]
MKFIFQALALLFAGFLVAGFTAAALAPPDTMFGRFALTPWDKLSHFLAFLCLAVVIGLTAPRNWLYRVCLALAVYGLALEYLQTGSGRTASLVDAGANLLGILAGAVPLRLLRPERRRSKRYKTS